MTTTLDQLRTMVKPEIVEAARQRADEALVEMALTQILDYATQAQQEIANATLTAPFPMPDANPLTLKAVKDYVETMGGHMRLTVSLPDGTTHGFRI